MAQKSDHAARRAGEHGADGTVPGGAAPSLNRGASVIADALRAMSPGPGVYRMLDGKGTPLYVGKARSLKKRVATYARPARLPIRLQRMVALTEQVEIITTHTEVEALLLESNLIKELKPRYNIVLRDDKSYPYILLTSNHAAPQMVKHRGARKRKGEYFGPFASAGAVNRTLSAVQKVFPLRNCSDSVYASRTRPCLQYQIKRCAAPCVGYISEEDYGDIVDEARDFLSGRSRDFQTELSRRMEKASGELEYEMAAIYRDRLRALAHIQTHQDVNISAVGSADVVAVHQEGGQSCVQVFFFRAGQNYGNRTYFPNHARDATPEDVIGAFLGQFYSDKQPPALVLVSHTPPDVDLLAEALTVRAERKVEVSRPARGTRRTLVQNAITNAREAMARRLGESAAQRQLLEGVQAAFDLEAVPDRIEVYDNSHISGTNAVGGMIVAGSEGFAKNAYRKFNIKSEDIAPGDDYGMMREVLTRRFSRAIKEDPDREGGTWPDLVLIDGGPGQKAVAEEVFADLGIDSVPFVAIAKGPDRDAGRERFYMPGREPFMMPPNDPVLYFLQRLRDEAHRFAIGSHRARRSKNVSASPLDDIPGVGRTRKRALLHHFGSAAAVARAGLRDLEAVDGISKTVAQKIYDHFQTE